MTKEKPKTYEAKVDGRKTRVTIPEDPDPEQMLIDAVYDNLSPHTTAAIVATLRTAKTENPDVNKQVRWFADLLTEMLGGGSEQNRLCEEIGL